MSIPRWKQTIIEKEKPPQTQLQPQPPPTEKQIDKSIKVSITTNCNTWAKSVKLAPPPTQPVKATPIGERVVFKIPRRTIEDDTTSSAGVSNTPSANRDPRMTRYPVTENVTTSAPAENIAEQTQVPITSDNTHDGRISVKDRLGNRLRDKPSIPSNFPNSGFIINDKTVGPIKAPMKRIIANPQLASAQNQQCKPSPVAEPFLKSIPNIAPAQSGQPSVYRLNVQQPHPDLPVFIRNGLEKKNLRTFEMPAFATVSQKYERVFYRLFERTCHHHMQNACPHPNECQLNHQLPDHDFFRTSIKKMDQKRVIDLYDEFMCRCQKLFDFYFVDFCDYFGEHMLTEKLKQMVDDCIERKVQFHFLNIIDGFMKTGKTYSKALIEVVQAITLRSIRTSKEIIKLILLPRNDSIRPFIIVLDSISKQENFKFKGEWVTRLLAIQIEKNIKELSPIIWRIAPSFEKGIQTIDQELLTKFMANPENLP